jgi:outer membrane protein TolC
MATAATVLVGCRSPRHQVELADRAAYASLAELRREVPGATGEFSVEPSPSALRGQLMAEQDLVVADPASRSARQTRFIDPWPHGLWGDEPPPAPEPLGDASLVLSLVDALQVAAANSRTYQDSKEAMFREALNLDLRRYDFSVQSEAPLDISWTHDQSGEPSEEELTAEVGPRLSRRLEQGALLSAGFTVNFLEALNAVGESALGLEADASVTLPLLRGAGGHIAREPLTQAERNLLYAVFDYERFKREFVVDIVRQFLDVLRRRDGVRNAEENYRRLRNSVDRTQALAEQERLPRIDVDQARQNELRARAGWISAQQDYAGELDRFKITLGLPPDARIEPDPRELRHVLGSDTLPDLETLEVPQQGATPESDPWLEESAAVQLALENRLDLQVAAGRIEDAQRQVVVAVDRLRPELTLGGTARWTASDQPSEFSRTLEEVAGGGGAFYQGLLTLDPAVDRRVERNALREKILSFQDSVRRYQEAEDAVKLDIREAVRAMIASRENVVIQRNAVDLALGRVDSTELFLNLGRAEVRDLLDAQSDLLDARNAYTAAQVNYRVAFLALQRDLGVLRIDEDGRWRERPYEDLLNHEED